MQGKKIKIIIGVLSILLVLSLAALIGTLVVRYASQREAASVELPGNIITPDVKDSSDADKGDPSDVTTDPSDDKTESSNDTTESSDSNNEVDPSVADTSDPSSSADEKPESVTEAVSEPGASEATETSYVSATKASVVSLHNRQPEDNMSFQAINMFPGDIETKYYCVKVSYKGDIIVRYHADIREGYEKLAEVLKVKIRLPETDKTLYDGLMRDMPDSLNHALYTDKSVQSELYYEITAYLDTSVDNEYQNKELIAGFRWWVVETENLDPPQTGDASNIYLWIALAVGSLFFMVILFAKRRKETSDEF